MFYVIIVLFDNDSRLTESFNLNGAFILYHKSLQMSLQYNQIDNQWKFRTTSFRTLIVALMNKRVYNTHLSAYMHSVHSN